MTSTYCCARVRPKEAWVNPQGGHVGRGPGWPDSRILSDVAMPWLVQVLKPD